MTRFDSGTQAVFGSHVRLRHHEVAARTGGPDELATVGVLLTPNDRGRRPWSTTMIRVHGPSDLTPEEVTEFGRLWNQSPETA